MALAVTLALAIALAGATAAAGPVLRFCDDPADPRFGTVELAGLGAPAGAETASRLRVYTARALAELDAPPAILGEVRPEPDGARFVPRFPFDGGAEYVATFDDLRLAFRMPRPAAAPDPPRVVGIDPGGDAWPANLLRIYVRFDRPMRVADATQRVALLDADGRRVPLAFVDVEGGLWSPDDTRLTLFLHPGRVKRGVAPNRELGPPLVEGGAMELRIDGAFADASGVPLGRDVVRRFRVVAPDRTPPDPARWSVEPPRAAGTREPLALRFPDPLDRALLYRRVRVLDPDGRPLAGEVEVGPGETSWTFAPAAPWRAGRHAVDVHPWLEDPAGNRPGRPFDLEVGAANGARDVETPALRLPFDVPSRG